jgi:rhomboid protease GluP
LTLKQDWLFWSTLKKLAVEGQYELITLSGDFQEAWLKSSHQKPTVVIRVLRHNFSWANMLEQDMEYVYEKSEQLRKQWFKRQLTVQNVYISDYEPINDWGNLSRTEQLMKGKSPTRMRTAIWTEANGQEEYKRLTNSRFHGDLMGDEQLYIHIEHVKQQVITHINSKQKEERALFEYGTPFLTFFFLAVQIMMFAVLEFRGGSDNTFTLIENGAKFNPFIFQGEWWRFITPILLHIGFLHLLMNSFALYYLGPIVEKIYGNARFLFIYLFSGFAGVLGSFLFSSSISAGASGAIFGCFGALLYVGRVHRQLFFRTMGYNIVAVIIINLIFGFIVPGIDNAGHIGGLAGGFLAALIVSLPKHTRYRERLIGLLVSAVLLAGGFLYGFSARNLEKDINYALGVAQKFNEEEQYEQAVRVLEPFEENNIQNSGIYFLLSYAQIKSNDLETGKKNLEKAVQADASFHEAYYNLALIYFNEGKVEQAQTAIEKAVKLQPQNKQYQQLLRQIETALQ